MENVKSYHAVRAERQAAVRILKWLMIASVVLPTVLFAATAWLDYRNFERITNDRIARSLDMLHEHSLKILQTADLAFGEVNEVLRDMSDDDIRMNEGPLQQRLKKIVADVPQMAGIMVVGRDGHPLVYSNVSPVPKDVDIARYDFFNALKNHDGDTYVSALITPLVDAPGSFFTLSRRRPSDDGGFNGVVAIGILKSQFENFYRRMSGEGGYFALARNDATFLARYPVVQNGDLKVANFAERVEREPNYATYDATSPVDNIERRIGHRKITGWPLYVLAGVEHKAITAEWLRYNINYLVYAAPLTIFLFAGLGLALRRTKILYDEVERRELAEDALRQAHRMEAIGQLTGGVAHDFNNLLMIVAGSAERLRGELTDKGQARLLEMITTASQRGESLTRQLLAYSRQQTLTPEVLDLGRRLPEVREMLTRSLRPDIEIKLDVQEGIAVRVDPGEFELAILNLAVNAKDAMTNGGTITIRVKPVTLKGEATKDGLSGNFVAIRVADTGHGIPADILTRVFEPFFTTKEVGKGTGLGLSQVYGFARQSGGTATISSAEGSGTAITVYLPRCYEKPSVTAPPVQTEELPEAAGTVLLVEDNSDVAEVGAGYLRQLGYRVRSVANSQAAIAALRLDSDVDLVFSDILMPGGMNGLELAREINARFPGIPVLLTTGYSASAQEAVEQGVVVLQKPYDLESLRRNIYEAIEGARIWQRRPKVEAVN